MPLTSVLQGQDGSCGPMGQRVGTAAVTRRRLRIREGEGRETVSLPTGYFTQRSLTNQPFWNLKRTVDRQKDRDYFEAFGAATAPRTSAELEEVQRLRGACYPQTPRPGGPGGAQSERPAGRR